MTTLKDYEKVVGTEVIDELFRLGGRLSHKKVVHVNETKVWGGVAEILNKLVPFLNETGIEAKWELIEGGEDFWFATKSFHNALHGANVPITSKMFDDYLRTNQENAKLLDLDDADFVVVHDPQPAALIQHFPNRRGKWIWRCHIDVSTPQPRVWEFLRPFISQYDAAVFHIDGFAKKDLFIRQFIIPPSIDPLSDKNRDISELESDLTLQKYGISLEKPIISQIGRFDRLKDPEGVVKVYQQLRKPGAVLDVHRLFQGADVIDATRLSKEQIDCQLILAGGVTDPDSEEIYQRLRKLAEGDKNVHLLNLPAFSDLDINALQRSSNVVLQKSLKEGFALTVTEALWKARPVIGGNTGGIPLQVIDGVNGFLVNSIEQCVERVRFLLKNPRKAEDMGKAGKEHVRRNFIITRHVRDHLLMYLTLELIPTKLKQL